MRQVINTKKNKSQLLTVIGMGLTLLLSSCNNSPNKTTNAETTQKTKAEATQKTKAEATQKTKEAGKLLPISEGNHWEYKHEIKDVESSKNPDYQPSRIKVDSVEETPLKEKIVSFNYDGPHGGFYYFLGKKKINIKNNEIHAKPLLAAKVIFKIGSNSGNYSYTINKFPSDVEGDKINVNVSYQQQQVSVPAGEFKGIRYDLNYDVVGTEKAEIEKMEQTFVLVKNIGIVYHRVTNTHHDSVHDSIESLLTDYHVSDKK